MTKARDLGDNAQNTKPKVINAKGDLIVGTGSDAADRLAVSDNGSTLVADSSTTTGLRWQGDYAAGKNKILNADCRINQRSFTSSTSASGWIADQWRWAFSGATGTASLEAFTPGTAPVAGYEGVNFLRLAITTGNDFCRIDNLIEDVRTLAGQTATLSFWAKGTNPTTAGNLKATLTQNFGSGGSADVSLTQNFTLTGSWTRYSLTFTLGGMSGKTIGANSYLLVRFGQGDSVSTDAWTLDLWGVQLEAGSVATPFQTATGTLAGELAACQRYYYRNQVDGARMFGVGWNGTTTSNYSLVPFPVTMRIRPTALEQSGTASHYQVAHGTTATVCSVVPAFGSDTTEKIGQVTFVVSSGLTAGQGAAAYSVNSSAYLGWSAEL